MGRFDFQSPGAAFVDQMTKVLADRKVQERQAMLDNLTKAADARAADEAKQMALYRADQMQTNAQNRDIAMADALTKGMRIGQKTTGMSPEQIAVLHRMNRLARPDVTAVPSVSTNETFNELQSQPSGDVKGAPITEPADPSIPAAVAGIPSPEAPPTPVQSSQDERYVGTKEEQDKEDRLKRVGVVTGVLMASKDPNDVKTGRYLSDVAEMNDGVIPPGVMEKVLTPKQQAMIFNKESGVIRPAVVGGKPFMQQGETTFVQDPYHAPPSAYKTDVIPKLSREGTILTMSPNGVITDTHIKAGPDPGETALGIPERLYNAHQNNLTALMAPHTDPKELAADATRYKQSAIEIIGNAKGISANVKALVRMAILDPYRVKTAINNMTLSPDEMRDLVALQAAAFPKEAADLLLQFTPPPKKEPVAVAPILKK